MKQTFLFSMMAMFITVNLCAQRWVDLMHEKNVNFYKVQKEAELYFKEHGTGKGTGYKQYKRWEYEMQRRIDKDGYILKTISDDWKSFHEYEKSVAVQSKTASLTTANWTEIGPKSKSPTSGWNPGVGRLTCIAVHPTNANIIYVGSPGGGCWKTTNGGTTWSPLTDHLPMMKVFALAIDRVNPSNVYLGTENGLILKSTNQGATWTTVYNNASTWKISKLLIHPSNGNIILASTTSGGILKSVNAGSSWTTSNTQGHLYFEDIEFKPNDPSVVYISGDNFLKSTDGGNTFTVVPLTNSGRTMIGVSAANGSYVYLVQANGSEFGRLYRSTNSGTSFSTQIVGSSAAGTNFFGYESSGTGTGGQAWYDMAICISPSNANEVIIGGIICWKSTNGGTSFSALTEWYYPNSSGYNHADIHALEYIGSTIYSGSDGGIYKSVNGGVNWTDLSAGLGIRQIYRLGSCASNGAHISSGSQDNGTTVRGAGGVWRDWLGADGMETMIDHNNTQILYGTSQNGGLYKSTDGGVSNTWVSNPNGSSSRWITPWVMHPTTSTTLFLGVAELYKSTDGASSWTQLSNFGYGAFDDLAIAPSNANYIYGFVGGKLVVTKNGGTTWLEYTPPFYINDIAVSPANPEKIVVVGFQNVSMSTNAGATWTDITGTLPAVYAQAVTIQTGANEGIYLGMSSGIYYRDNTLSNWVPFFDNLPLVEVTELEINYNTNKIIAATYGRGLWESSLYSANTNLPPAVSITAPANNSTYTAPATITINANATDSDGIVTNVQFYNGATLLGSDNTSPYSFVWNNVAAGTYSLTAKATDDDNDFTISSAVTVIVNPPSDINGPTCGSLNQSAVFELSPQHRVNATSYGWWNTASIQSITPLSGSYTVTVSYGPNFLGGDLCVGVGYSVSPWYKQFCKRIDLCTPRVSLNESDLTESEALTVVFPNPTDHSFSLHAGENISAMYIVDALGKTAHQQKNIASQSNIAFGADLNPGIYVVVLEYTSGRKEVQRIEKLK